MKDLFQKISQFFSINNEHSKKPLYLVIIATVAIFLLLLGNLFSANDQKKTTLDLQRPPNEKPEETMNKTDQQDGEVDMLEASYEKDLQQMLEKIQGVSEVEVMINLDSTHVHVYEKNLIKGQQITDEADNNGGIRKVDDQTEETQVVLIRQGDQEVPLLIQTKKPDVRGVFVVAKGVDQPTVKMWVIEAVSKVLDVPSHKVSVMPKNE